MVSIFFLNLSNQLGSTSFEFIYIWSFWGIEREIEEERQREWDVRRAFRYLFSFFLFLLYHLHLSGKEVAGGELIRGAMPSNPSFILTGTASVGSVWMNVCSQETGSSLSLSQKSSSVALTPLNDSREEVAVTTVRCHARLLYWIVVFFLQAALHFVRVSRR